MFTIHAVMMNLFQHLLHLKKRQTLKQVQGDGAQRACGSNCRPEKLQGGILFQNGFTLIELLVVVLIIGILAAIALPQYQAATDKARYVQLIAVVKPIKDAAERYYLANGVYPTDLATLDVQMPAGCASTTDTTVVFCVGYMLDFQDGANANVQAYNGGTWVEYTNAYIQWLDQSDKAGRHFCSARPNDERAVRLCKSMGGSEAGKNVGGNNCSSCDLYELP